jgi:hypothetical protein
VDAKPIECVELEFVEVKDSVDRVWEDLVKVTRSHATSKFKTANEA